MLPLTPLDPVTCTGYVRCDSFAVSSERHLSLIKSRNALKSKFGEGLKKMMSGPEASGFFIDQRFQPGDDVRQNCFGA